MGRSSSFLITVLMCLFLPGTLIQNSHSLENSDSTQISQSPVRPASASSLSGKEIFYSESSTESVQGGGHNNDSATSHRLISKTLVSKEHEMASSENHCGARTTLTETLELSPHHLGANDQGADKANTSITEHTHSGVHIISDETLLEGSHTAAEVHSKDRNTSIVNDDSLDAAGSRELVKKNPREPGGSCVPGLKPCVVLKSLNGTSLLWNDMSRTLAFAWELHVFGSASLFILMAILAVLGMAGASCTLPRSPRDATTLANCLLIAGGTLRGILLLLDPYGTQQILSHAALTAMQNVPLQLLLWAQVALALVTLRGLKLLFLPLKLQPPWVVGGLAISHCTLLFVADLYSSTLSPAVPLLLQTLSLCWGLPLCMGILTKSISHPDPLLRPSVPQWFPSLRINRQVKQVTAMCAFLGVLCCSLQMYSLLWLYGLLGNWRRFGWYWWLSQFWARALELSWGFCLLVLEYCIFWLPSRGHSRGDHWQGGSEVSTGVEEKSWWWGIMTNAPKRPQRKSEKTWEELMPTNWAKYDLSGVRVSNNITCPYHDQSDTIIAEYMSDAGNNSSSDSQAAALCQKAGEPECSLSLMEFDMSPSSPINLRRSIDDALLDGQVVAQGLFTTPPWTHNIVTDANDGDSGTTTLPPTCFGCEWMLDSESISASQDHFQPTEPMQSLSATSQTTVYNGHELLLSIVTNQHDWPYDNDVIEL